MSSQPLQAERPEHARNRGEALLREGAGTGRARRPSRAPAARPAVDSGPRRRARPWSRRRRRRGRSSPPRSPGAPPRCPRRSRASCRRRACRRASGRRRRLARPVSRGVRVTGTASRGQRSAPDSPVPRWSNTTRSRLRPAAKNVLAQSIRKGVADWPGPPASVINAPVRAPRAFRRSTCSFTEPGTAPARSTGTGNSPHSISDPRTHGLNEIAASDGVTGNAVSATATRIPATRRMRLTLLRAARSPRRVSQRATGPPPARPRTRSGRCRRPFPTRPRTPSRSGSRARTTPTSNAELRPAADSSRP